MSFGRPPTSFISTVLPPAKGSFPLDHDGECKQAMVEYMKCIKANQSNNGACRHLSKKYLECRMDRNLMERESLPNLGFGEAQMQAPTSTSNSTLPSSSAAAAQASSKLSRGDRGSAKEATSARGTGSGNARLA